MKLPIALIAIALMPLLWFGLKPHATVATTGQYDLATKTTFDHGVPETVYTLSERLNDGKMHEKWLVTLPEEHSAHWLAADGTVWVLTTSSGGPAKVWARNPYGDLVGQFPLSSLGSTKETDVDAGQTQAATLHDASEQLHLMVNGGDEQRLTLARLADGSSLPLVHAFHQGLPKNDLVTDFLNERTYSEVQVEWPLGADGPVSIWRGNGYSEKGYLAVTFESAHPYRIRSERYVSSIPTSVMRTPSGRILWFQLGGFTDQRSAVLDVLSPQGDLIDTVDLMQLGKFGSSDDVRASLRLKELQIERDGTLIPLDSAPPSDPSQSEVIRFSDATGRQYIVSIEPAGASVKVSAVASLNLDNAPIKEPANLQPKSEQTVSSDDGNYELNIKTLAQDKAQLTLTANVHDPVQGRKRVQLWSGPFPVPSSVRVSNSGRVYALVVVPFSKTPSAPAADHVLLNTWEPNGKQPGGLDLVALKWFSSPEEAVKGLDLKNMKIDLEDTPVRTEVSGVPVTAWPIEALTFPFNDGRSESLYLKRINDYMPSMYVRGKPKGDGKP